VTFTVPNVLEAGDLPAALENLIKGFERLRRQNGWPKKARGLWSLEIVWSPERGFHPHIHAVVDLPWIDYRWLGKAWLELTGAKHCPDVKRPENERAREGLVFEALKYILKPGDIDPSALRSVLAVTAGRRMCNPFGGLRARSTESTEDCRLHCPGCERPVSGCRGEFAIDVMTTEMAAVLKEGLKAAGRKVFDSWLIVSRENPHDPTTWGSNRARRPSLRLKQPLPKPTH
jgi:hypothetical protein